MAEIDNLIIEPLKALRSDVHEMRAEMNSEFRDAKQRLVQSLELSQGYARLPSRPILCSRPGADFAAKDRAWRGVEAALAVTGVDIAISAAPDGPGPHPAALRAGFC